MSRRRTLFTHVKVTRVAYEESLNYYTLRFFNIHIAQTLPIMFIWQQYGSLEPSGNHTALRKAL